MCMYVCVCAYVYYTTFAKISSVIAGGPVVYAATISYASIGREDAVGVNLTFSRLSSFIRGVAIQKEVLMTGV